MTFLDDTGVEHLAADIKALSDDRYVIASGDTMTGNLQIQSPNIDISSDPSSDVYDKGVELVDANGNLIAQFQAMQMSTGRTGIWLGASRVVNGNQVDNKVRLAVDSSGNKQVVVSSPGPWRNALGLVPTIVSGLTAGSNVNLGSNTFAWTMGDLCMVSMNLQISATLSSGSTIISGLPQNSSNQVSFAAARGGSTYSAAMRIQGGASIVTCDGAISQTGWYDAFFIYILG